MNYRIGELAELFGVTKEGIRYYERRGIISSTRTEGGARIYDRDAIITLKRIRSYQALGFSLQDAEHMGQQTDHEEAERRL